MPHDGRIPRAMRARDLGLPVGLVAIAAAALFLAYRPIRSDIDWMSDFRAAQETARSQEKPLLLYFSATWCLGCRQMSRWTWPNDDVEQAVMGSFVPVKIDVSNIDERQPIAELYAVDALPAIVVADSRGHPIDAHAGYLDAAQLLSFLGADPRPGG